MNDIITPTKDEIIPTIGGATNVVEFTNGEFGKIRTITIDGEPWFVANDVAKALDYANPSDATKKHCKRAEMRWGSDSLGRPTEFKVIPEGDLYRLVAKSLTLNSIVNQKAPVKYKGFFHATLRKILTKSSRRYIISLPNKLIKSAIFSSVCKSKLQLFSKEYT